MGGLNGFTSGVINALEFMSFEWEKRVVKLFNVSVLLSIIYGNSQFIV